MNSILTILLILGVAWGVSQACDISSCSPGGKTCKDAKAYIDCLSKKVDGCEEGVAKTAAETTLKAAKDVLAGLKCSGTMVTVSISTLMVALVASYFRF